MMIMISKVQYMMAFKLPNYDKYRFFVLKTMIKSKF